MNQTQQVYSSLVWLVLFSALMYFIVIRPQQQQQKKRLEMISTIKTGDRIVTVGGVVGTVTQVRNDSLSVRIADRVEVELMKSGIGYVKDR